jgi:hypothetical protein
MNWGRGIILAMALFMGFILFLVVNIMLHTVDLESEDYYKKEINYEQEITAMKNFNAVNSRIGVSSNAEFVVFQLPEKTKIREVEIHFFRPNNTKLDKLFQVNGTKTYLVPKTTLEKGNYSIQLHFKHNQKPCLQKEEITI